MNLPPSKLVTTVARTAALLALITSHYVAAQTLDLNYDRLSSLEQPLAVELADTTFAVTGLLDAAYRDLEDADSDAFVIGNIQISAETQLANSWTLGASYFASDSSLQGEDYQDNAAIFVSGVWGRVALGDVTGQVRENTRRRRGIGNAFLAFDDQLGQLAEKGASYTGRYGPTIATIVVDEEGDFEVGGTYQRPLDNKDIRLSLRYREAQFQADNRINSLESNALGLMAELTYGSTIVDLGLGVEQLTDAQFSVDRRYLSFGAAHKKGSWSASAEAHLGDIEGVDEHSLALGVSYDIARGLSANLGINYRDALVELNGVQLLNRSDTSALGSLRYSF